MTGSACSCKVMLDVFQITLIVVGEIVCIPCCILARRPNNVLHRLYSVRCVAELQIAMRFVGARRSTGREGRARAWITASSNCE